MKLCHFEAGLDKPLFLIAGPCVVESLELQMDTAGELKRICDELAIPFIFKSSYDKANRSSGSSFRGLGMDSGLRILADVRKALGVPVLTDVHTAQEVPEVASVVDVLQTPAFLCRQTDFIHAVASAGKPVNIKKGQFLAPGDMKNVAAKAKAASGRDNILVCERGVSFVETSTGIEILHKRGFLQEHFSPEIGAYGDDVKEQGKSGGVFFCANRELYIGLGYNTKAVPVNDAPKNYAALLDPKWKGKMTIAGGSSGPRWIGHISNTMGREFVEKFSQQDVKVQNIVPAALANQVVSGEVPLSPTIFDSNIVTSKRKGAPVEWRPLEPVLTNVGSSGMTTRSPHPHAALLFLDYLHSKEGQQVVMKGGLNSPRDDMDVEQKFKKNYLENQYSLEEFEKKFAEWQDLMKRLFIRAAK